MRLIEKCAGELYINPRIDFNDDDDDDDELNELPGTFTSKLMLVGIELLIEHNMGNY